LDYLQTLKFFSLIIILFGCSSKPLTKNSTVIGASSFNLNKILSNNFNPIKAGHYQTGPKVRIDEAPIKNIQVKNSYEIQTTEMTQLIWVLIMKNNPSVYRENIHCTNHSILDGIPLCPDNPVENINKGEIDQFISKLNNKLKSNYRLPNEVEWENTVRDINLHHGQLGKEEAKAFALFENELKRTIPVKSKKPIINGLFGTAGNVWEVTSSTYDKFEFTAGKTNHSPDTFIIKGGGWNSKFDHLRKAYRGKWPKDLKSKDVGFRLIKI